MSLFSMLMVVFYFGGAILLATTIPGHHSAVLFSVIFGAAVGGFYLRGVSIQLANEIAAREHAAEESKETP